MLPLAIHLDLFARRLVDRARARVVDEQGQTSAEYALVLLGAAAVALLVTAWAGQTDRVRKLLDAIFDNVIKMVKAE